MDWGTIAALISALAAAVTAWVTYREYQDKKNTGQPRSAQRSAPPSVPTQSLPSQPRQAGILSSKKARRSVLGYTTVLGLGLIALAISSNNQVLFLCGNGILLGLWWFFLFFRCRAERWDLRNWMGYWWFFLVFDRSAWERGEVERWDFRNWVFIWFGGLCGCGLAVCVWGGIFGVLWRSFGGGGGLWMIYFPYLIVYLTSIYIGRW
jgi:hypothetical protein